jgi:hypothetical protein
MQKIEENPSMALEEFMSMLQRSLKRTKGDKEKRKILNTLRSANEIADGVGYQHGAKDMKEAAQFLVSNYLMSGSGLGVIKNEDIVVTVASMITEDVNFYPLTPTQKKLKAIAESYGLTVVVL